MMAKNEQLCQMDCNSKNWMNELIATLHEQAHSKVILSGQARKWVWFFIMGVVFSSKVNQLL